MCGCVRNLVAIAVEGATLEGYEQGCAEGKQTAVTGLGPVPPPRRPLLVSYSCQTIRAVLQNLWLRLGMGRARKREARAAGERPIQSKTQAFEEAAPPVVSVELDNAEP